MAKEDEKKSAIKFVQILASGDSLYALDDEGRVFDYDSESGWQQMERDDVRLLLEVS